eukprot:TRINITY_DN1751_c0_g1_i2.p1 TRINITY_DN1751_c0_g1~~TRINITY_DN1751_c0_g1_i2.p1  ORF type:complete len:366 (+),score=37.45 TRINITY_DN1751_c0_g1_i2:99-1196(+)
MEAAGAERRARLDALLESVRGELSNHKWAELNDGLRTALANAGFDKAKDFQLAPMELLQSFGMSIALAQLLRNAFPGAAQAGAGAGGGTGGAAAAGAAQAGAGAGGGAGADGGAGVAAAAFDFRHSLTHPADASLDDVYNRVSVISEVIEVTELSSKEDELISEGQETKQKETTKRQTIGSIARITKEGLCVTAAHVVRNAATKELLTMTAWDNQSLTSECESVDNDIALLKGPAGPAFDLPRIAPALGRPVLFAGFPRAVHDELQMTTPVITFGRISGFSADLELIASDYHGPCQTPPVARCVTIPAWHLDDPPPLQGHAAHDDGMALLAERADQLSTHHLSNIGHKDHKFMQNFRGRVEVKQR